MGASLQISCLLEPDPEPEVTAQQNTQHVTFGLIITPH